jgi:hypothetical protein
MLEIPIAGMAVPLVEVGLVDLGQLKQVEEEEVTSATVM